MSRYKAEKTERAERGEQTGRAVEWFLWIEDAPRPGWTNMAIDQALLERSEQTGEAWLRLYTWDPQCLSFGRHEPAARRYDAARIANLKIDTVRRPTGGRAVWHSRELTYAVAAPCRWFGSLQAAYLEIHAMLAQALLALAVPVSLAPRSPAFPVDAGACFSHAAGGEVMADARKLVGSAQLRRTTAFLQHGSILLRDEQQLVASLQTGASRPFEPLSFPPSEELSAAEVIDAISATAQGRWAGTWHRISSPAEVLQAASRHYSQFRSPTWTWMR